ncbi:MAG: biopolymer transporter ExbD [Chitinophagales bacterium]|nr:biopolymer transporter ExbD [Chitinophagales bacterium]
MAEITQQAGKGSSRRSIRNRNMIKIDFTPMVDLGFLLITFFMLTTVLSRGKAIPIPRMAEGPPTELADTSALTIVLTADRKVQYYFGAKVDFRQTDLSANGLRKILMKRNQEVYDRLVNLEKARAAQQISASDYFTERSKIKNNKYTLEVIVKAKEDVDYQILVDMMDELSICRIQRYAVMDINDEERGLLAMNN